MSNINEKILQAMENLKEMQCNNFILKLFIITIEQDNESSNLLI